MRVLFPSASVCVCVFSRPPRACAGRGWGLLHRLPHLVHPVRPGRCRSRRGSSPPPPPPLLPLRGERRCGTLGWRARASTLRFFSPPRALRPPLPLTTLSFSFLVTSCPPFADGHAGTRARHTSALSCIPGRPPLQARETHKKRTVSTSRPKHAHGVSARAPRSCFLPLLLPDLLRTHMGCGSCAVRRVPPALLTYAAVDGSEAGLVGSTCTATVLIQVHNESTVGAPTLPSKNIHAHAFELCVWSAPSGMRFLRCSSQAGVEHSLTTPLHPCPPPPRCTAPPVRSSKGSTTSGGRLPRTHTPTHIHTHTYTPAHSSTRCLALQNEVHVCASASRRLVFLPQHELERQV